MPDPRLHAFGRDSALSTVAIKFASSALCEARRAE
jgi:hypothetical protein